MPSMPAPSAKSFRNSAALLAAAWLCVGAARADALDVLVAAYPRTLAGRDGNRVLFRNGVSLDVGRLDDGTPFAALLTHASVRDQLLIPYPAGPMAAAPPDDPGRLRNKAFFDAMYGDCRKGEVEPRLVPLVWLPKAWGHTIRITAVNGVAARLEAVSEAIDALPPDIRRAAWPIAGTYACRGVADRGQPSMHAYGAAIDLNLAASNYWLWEKDGGLRYRNRMPEAIVAAFERQGFIWGGKWRHFDTMHFEYRPELLPLAGAPGLR